MAIKDAEGDFVWGLSVDGTLSDLIPLGPGVLVKSGIKAPPLLDTGEESPDDVAIFVPIRIKLERAPTFDAFAFAVIDLVFSLR